MIKKEPKTEKEKNSFWPYKILTLGITVLLMVFYFVLAALEHGFKKVGFKKGAKIIKELNYKILRGIISYLKK